MINNCLKIKNVIIVIEAIDWATVLILPNLFAGRLKPFDLKKGLKKMCMNNSLRKIRIKKYTGNNLSR